MKHYVKPETDSFQVVQNNTLCASVNVGVELGTMKVKDFTTPILALLFGGLLTFSSCTSGNEDINPPTKAFQRGEIVSITTDPIGSSSKMPKRVHIGNEANNEAQLVWTSSDHLRVIVQDNSTSFAYSDFNLTAGAETKTGTFTGAMPADGTEFFLAYPCGNVRGSKYEEGVITFQQVEVPNVQHFTVGATTFEPGIMPVIGYGKDDNGILMGTTTIVGGALRIKLTNSTGADIIFNKIQLYVHDARVSESGEKTSVWGTYTVDYDVSSKTATPSGITAGNSNSVLNLSQEVTLGNGATSDDFYFVMLAPLYFSSSEGKSFTVYLYNYDGEVTATSDLTQESPVAITSFNYNISIEPGDITQGTLVMTNQE